MLRPNLIQFLFVIAFSSTLAITTGAQEVTTETVIDGLDHPTAIAIQPDSGTMFICDAKANKIVRIVDGKKVDAFTGFTALPIRGYDFEGGPTAMEFVDEFHLVVGTSGSPDGPMTVHGFNLKLVQNNKESENSESDSANPIVVNKSSARWNLELQNGSDENRGQVNCLVASPNGFFMACTNHSDDNGFIAKIDRKEDPPTSLRSILGHEKDASIVAPSSIAISSEGYLAFIQNDPDKGAILNFCSEGGVRNGTFNTGLSKVNALAYGPNRGRLYLADFESGAIYKLIEADNDNGCEAVEVVRIPRVSSLKFVSNGDLFATTLSQDGNASGKVVKIVGLDSPEQTSSQE